MVTDAENELFSKSFPKNIQLVFAGTPNIILKNEDIVQESLEVEESLCSDMNLRYGACEASCMRIRVVNSGSFKGKTCTLSMSYKGETLLVNDNDDYVVNDKGNYIGTSSGSITHKNIGKYIVYSDKPTADRRYRDLVCYDAMYEALNVDVADWYNNLTFPCQLNYMLRTLLTYLNIPYTNSFFVNNCLNYNYLVQGGAAVDSLSSKDILEDILEIMGVFGHIDAAGYFKVIKLPSNTSFSPIWYQNGSCVYEDYVTEAITGVTSYTTDGTIGVEVGTDGNVYKIEDNLVLYGDEGSTEQVTALTNLLNRISTVTYRPYSVRTYGDPYVDLGTGITIETSTQTINSFVMTRFLSGIQSMTDEYRADGDQYLPGDVNEIRTAIKRLKGKTISMETNFDDMSSEFVLKLDNNGKIVKVALGADASTGTEFKVEADNLNLSANDVFDIISGGTLNLTGKNIAISSTNFSVTTAGAITATSGTIGGFNIDTSKLYNGVTSISDTSHDGVYVGTDGIVLGKGVFKVTNTGAVTCTNLTTSGTSINLSAGYFKLNSTGLSYGPYRDYTNTFNDTGIYLKNSSYNCVLSFQADGIYYDKATGTSTTTKRRIVDVYSTVGSVKLGTKFGGYTGYGIAEINAEKLTISGTKSRVVKTNDYGDRLMYCYESPTPMFGDIGEGVIANDGKCYIWLDSVFTQTINNQGYQVFLQKYGQGECYVSERTPNYFVVEGNSGLSFGWEIKAKQDSYEMLRLDKEEQFELIQKDYGNDAINHIQNIQIEREVA